MTVGTVTRRLFSAIAVGLEAPVEITGHEKIKFAIVVIIEESGACTPSTSPDAGFFCNIGKRPISIVVIKDVPTITGHVEILETVIVIIAHSYTHTVVAFRHSAEAGAI